MAFKISPKFKVGDIKSKSLDTAFLGKYYKGIQQTLLKKTSVENSTEYFFCQDFTGGEPLLVFGNASATHRKTFREAGKGKDGFDKNQVSIGTCFVLKENNKSILCLQPNMSLGKAKKKLSLKVLDKMRRQKLKQFAEIRWLDGPLIVGADGEVEEVNTDQTSTPTEENTTSTGGAPSSDSNASKDGHMVPRDKVVKRAQELQRGIDKLKNDLMPRYKEQQITPRDGAFVKALRKAALIFLTKLAQTDAKTQAEFASNKEYLDVALPQWKDLEGRLGNQKANKEARKELKDKLEKVVETMNDTRKEIKKLLKRVNLKTLS
ncbi:MAG: hypothetical protein ACRBFS_00730 [Aureispira sp.]